MPLGDSITDGVESYNDTTLDLPKVAERVGYRKALFERLGQEGYAVDFVGTQSSGSGASLADPQHEGHPGAQQDDLATGIVGWLNVSKPDVVMLHIGTNDVLASTSAALTSTLLSNVNTWTGTLTNPPVRLLLAKIINQKSGTPKVAEFNNNLESMYNSTWTDSSSRSRFVVRLVDMNTKLNLTTDMSDFAADTSGLHPSKEGFGKMANAWFDYLVANEAIHKCP